MVSLAEAVLALSTAPTGFTASELAQKVRAMSGEAESAYGPRRAAYDLKNLRGKGMVRKIATSRRYEPEPDGLRAMTALVSSAKRLSGRCLPPANGPSHRPNRTIPHRSITITNISGSPCGSCLLRWGWPHKDRQSLFHLFL